MTDLLYRITYQVLGRIRFLSHKELMRVMARAFRRARLPLAFSQGYHPHPKLSFGPPRSTGMAAEAEQLDARLTTPCTPRELAAALASQMPAGLRIVRAEELSPRSPSITASTRAATYACAWPHGADPPEAAIDRLLAHPSLVCARSSGSGVRSVNLRPGILDVRWRQPRLALTLALAPDFCVRPTEVVAALTGWPDDAIRRIVVTRTGFVASPSDPGCTSEPYGARDSYRYPGSTGTADCNRRGQDT